MPDNQVLDETVARDPDRVRIDDEVVTYIDHFVFRLRGRCYALPPGSVEQVTPVQPIVAVPTVPPHVRGVVHLRGRIIAVVDLAALLGVDGDAEPGGNPRLVVIGGAQPFGFVVDGTLGIWAIAAAPIRSDDDGALVRGRIEVATGAATVLDGAALLERLLAASPEAA